MSLEHAILGFLSDGPSSGYDLKKRFDATVAHFWPADRTQIYRTLARLQGAARVRMVHEPQDGKPDRKIYHLTDSGRVELDGWLGSEVRSEVREATLVQVFFAHHLDDAGAERLLRQQIADIETALAQLEAIVKDVRGGAGGGGSRTQRAADARAAFFRRLTLEHGIAMQRAELEFHRRALTRFRRRAKRAWESSRERT